MLRACRSIGEFDRPFIIELINLQFVSNQNSSLKAVIINSHNAVSAASLTRLLFPGAQDPPTLSFFPFLKTASLCSKISRSTRWIRSLQILLGSFEVFQRRFLCGEQALVHFQEWGDRLMLATITLGAAQSPWGVASGAITGRLCATVIAILGGALLANYISEKLVEFATQNATSN